MGEKDPLNKLIKLSDYKEKVKQREQNQEHITTEKSSDDTFPRKYPAPSQSETDSSELERIKKLTVEVEKRDQNITVTDNDFIGCKVDYKNELNSSQLQAVTTLDGPILVIAGAGTGKTRTIVYRVSYLLEQGVLPEEILLLTFTKKASQEMTSRVDSILGDNRGNRVKGGTFHSFAFHMLRRYSGLLGLSPKLTILDQLDSEDVVDLLRSEYEFNQKERAFPKKERIFEIISKARNTNRDLYKIVEEEYTGLYDYIEDLNTLYKGYQEYKKHYRLLDFDDLLIVLRDNLKSNLRFKEKVHQEITHILVDEYQDTNILQKEIVDLISDKTENVMVVGDDFQSIYKFRGANLENILTFPSNYPYAKVIKLEENYRSRQSLLNFSNDIIKSAEIGYKKALYSDLKEGDLPQLGRFYFQQDEAYFIVSKILDKREQGVALSDQAVLYRAGFHSSYIQTELIRRQIPYVVYGGVKFMERKHVKDMISYLRLLVNPFDAVSWNRVLKLLPGIGQVRASQIVEEIYNQDGRLQFDTFQNTFYYKSLALLKKALEEANKEKTVAKAVSRIWEYYLPILKNREPDAKERENDLEVLYKLARNYQDLDKFLADLSLEPPSNSFQKENTPAVDEQEEEQLVLSTIHSSKGLEWHTVYVPHLLDGLFPTSKSLRDIFSLEEERRLFYVAVTRAKEQLYLTFPNQVITYDGYFIYPSRFLQPIENNKYNFFED
ncbi:ATP-dependent helicase [Natranaerobius trueperi]|uniref:DNA 3'-5' helicase n=1 Tax=Natranaerobius trueperi TaxID=759412 RepID=A0A226C3M0_9FIRM|nr:ATP-dependent helicase [Natranaerobius trueperi]OWZ85010.1 hypothetical protein CDO51_01015 [Natranaerobius trueperi]